MIRRVRSWLGAPTSGASLGIFRIGFGIVQLWQTWDFFRPVLGQTTIEYFYTGSQVHWNFPYLGFEWVRPLPEPFTTIVFLLLGLTSLAVMLGIFTRPSLLLNGVLFTYGWLLEAVWWNNHFYLTSLIAFLLFVSPSGRCFSIDRWWQIRRKGRGHQWDGLIPFWPILLLRAQLFIVYTYAAVVKMNADWFMGEPIRMWFRKGLVAKPLAAVLPADVMEQVHSLLSSEIFIYSLVWGGLLFDLSIGILLCIRRTQLLALVLMFLFHGTNFWIFMIGAFPLMAISSTLIFLDTDWPLRLWTWLRQPRWIPPDPGWMLLGMIVVPVIGAVLGWRLTRSPRPPATASFPPISSFGLVCVVMWILAQSIIPLRHLTIEGDVHWTLEGSRFAWQVMARSHVSHVIYKIRDPEWAKRSAASNKIDWPMIDGASNDWIYYDVDCTNVRPTDFPEIVIISEPWVRDRVFFNSGAKSVGYREASEKVRELWQRRYGRAPDAIIPTLPLREILLNFRRRMEQSAASDEQIRARAIQECNALVKHVDQMSLDIPEDPLSLERALDLQNILNIFRDTTRTLGLESQFMQELIKVRPWDIQSGHGMDWI
ncbi:HTTM domain-containing protein, partial [bacterium]|nr:HTTM domain-containing protein [bacterium]